MDYPLSDIVANEGPTIFGSDDLAAHRKLFKERAALVYTPTAHFPASHVGSGELSIFIPVCTPDFFESLFIRTYSSPRFWLDQIQQHSGMLRWTPVCPAKVSFTRHDTYQIRSDHFIAGTKGLMDALKVKTTGRIDGRMLYYFGAIIDDDLHSVSTDYQQVVVDSPSRSGMQITVASSATAINA